MSFHIKKAWFKPYQYQVTQNDITYHIKVLPVSSRHILTINSKYIWNIKSGSVKGLQYKTHRSHLVDMRDFYQYTNPVVVFKARPYKILQYLNESDIVDISSESSVHGIPFYTDLKSFLASLEKSSS
jgi:hypothetical protein